MLDQKELLLVHERWPPVEGVADQNEPSPSFGQPPGPGPGVPRIAPTFLLLLKQRRAIRMSFEKNV
jgi:hypothetical protein